MQNRGSCPKCRSAIDAALDVAQKAASERWEDKQWVLEMMIWLGGSNGYGIGVLWVKNGQDTGTRWHPRYLTIVAYWMFIRPYGHNRFWPVPK